MGTDFDTRNRRTCCDTHVARLHKRGCLASSTEAQEKPATDPGYYLDEPTLAVELFPCRSCGVLAGSPCVQETHIGRVDMLRSLRAYTQGRN